jgi:hypothetical protein
MRIFKYRAFRQWAKAEGLSDSALKNAIKEIELGLFEANLGGGLYKKRVARKGQGKIVVIEQLLRLKKIIAVYLFMVTLKMNEITSAIKRK